VRVPILSFLEDHLPPNDVLMVWHAYLLNPGFVSCLYLCILFLIFVAFDCRWFSEDCLRFPELQNLGDLGGIPPDSIVRSPTSLPKIYCSYFPSFFHCNRYGWAKLWPKSRPHKGLNHGLKNLRPFSIPWMQCPSSLTGPSNAHRVGN
jgi:hypothetical protein